MIEHPIDPVYDQHSEILILGSFPSVKTREVNFFYGHPQNRFWKVMAAVYEEQPLVTTEQKRAFLLRNHIAVWDVIKSCEIQGSADSSIKNVVPNDLSEILRAAKISHIFVNGKKAEQLYRKYIEKQINRKAEYLPSTSPANAAWSLERLVEEWKTIRI
ncbi:MAG: DNA-deoxyinosine glycosylase [bacterium]|nr:DNA-deoxyinosine glycosylase [bacterium]